MVIWLYGFTADIPVVFLKKDIVLYNHNAHTASNKMNNYSLM